MSRCYIIPGIKSKDEIIAEAFNVRKEAMTTRTRERDVVEARHFAMWYLYNYEGLSFARSGEAYNRDHATVVYACRQVENLMQVDKRFQRKAINAMRMLNALSEAKKKIYSETL